MRLVLVAALALVTPSTTQAQWQLQDAHTTADLRGIDAVGNGIAWASGTNGTVLRTEDAGSTWQPCKTPPGAEHLDFRGVQAADKNTAIVMSSGKGDLSRLYRTTDGCQTWKLVFTSPNKTGFFDAIHRVTANQIFVLGDPVDGKFQLFTSRDAGSTWFIEDDPGLNAPPKAGAFAASNSSLTNLGPFLLFGTGGPQAAVYRVESACDAKTGVCSMEWHPAETPLAHGPAEAGIFSVGGRFAGSASGKLTGLLVAVGGTYNQPGDSAGTAALSQDNGKTWRPATTPPHGYRSAVAYDKAHNTWISVGPNGTDLSTDDGGNWHPLTPAKDDAPDADSHWNALSLPFVVGPHGRIGTLRPDALPKR